MLPAMEVLLLIACVLRLVLAQPIQGDNDGGQGQHANGGQLNLPRLERIDGSLGRCLLFLFHVYL